MIYDTRKFVDDVPATAPDQIQSLRWYNNSRKPMRPERVHGIWERRSDDPYALGEWVFRELYVTGSLIKKDGTVGKVAEESHFIRYGEQRQDIPAWLSSTINAIQPGGGW